jgi:two-component system LytT family response regulator
MIRAILVDDEASAIQWLGDLLSSQPEIDVVGTATSVAAAVTLLETVHPEVVFLDISMPQRCGMALFASVHADIRIVLVTAHNDRALEAFEVGAFDYILKPVTAARLNNTIQRLSLSLRKPASVPTPAVKSGTLTIQARSGTILLSSDQVLWIQAQQNYSIIYPAVGEPLLVKRLLGDFNEELPAWQFARVGRSLLVNLGTLREIGKGKGNGALLHFVASSATLAIGRAATVRLRQLLALRSS